MKNGSPEYDVFLSYARADDENRQHVTRLIQAMQRVFRSHTGHPLRIFIDKQEIATAQVWEKRILSALRRSSVMVAIISPSYFTSEWCGREWDYFRSLERERSVRLGIATYATLIFPVALQDLDRVLRPSDAMRRRMQEAAARQYVDFKAVSPDDPQFEDLVSKLVDDIIDVLLGLDDGAGPVGDAAADAYELGGAEVSTSAALESPTITTRYGRDREQFIKLLSEAINVTLIGVTNDRLAESLQEALTRKRRKLGPDAFWESIRVVFLNDSLLPLVNDDLLIQFPSRDQALRERAQKAGLGKRAMVSFLLRANQPDKWTLYSYSYLLPFVGALFGMADGSKLVQIATGRPRRGISEHLFFQFVDRADQYFASAFQEVIEHSQEENEVVLVGAPANHTAGFYCRGARFRRGVMLDGMNTRDWLPAVIVVTWRYQRGLAVPLLQVNTIHNSTREIGKVSHLSGYVNQQDYVGQHDDRAEPGVESEFILSLQTAQNAVARELREELRVEVEADRPRLDKTLRFYYPDKENLFFYLFELQLPPRAHFPPNAEIHSWAIGELLRVRDHQVLCNVLNLLEQETLTPKQIEIAAQILDLNLILHERGVLGARLIGALQGSNGDLGDLTVEVGQLVEQTRYSRYSSGYELRITGLAGLQYREFFSSILPLYAKIGVPEAEDHLRRVMANDAMTAALEGLMTLYSDESKMMTLPLEV